MTHLKIKSFCAFGQPAHNSSRINFRSGLGQRLWLGEHCSHIMWDSHFALPKRIRYERKNLNGPDSSSCECGTRLNWAQTFVRLPVSWRDTHFGSAQCKEITSLVDPKADIVTRVIGHNLSLDLISPDCLVLKRVNGRSVGHHEPRARSNCQIETGVQDSERHLHWPNHAAHKQVTPSGTLLG